jgi:ribosomal protein S18 acetylase RimI-like enzyme
MGIREIRDGDWDDIVALETATYTETELSETPAALRSRCAPTTSFVLEVETEDQLVGYLLALPYPLFRYPDLSRPEDTTFASSNLHLHDLVIAVNRRGRGLATDLLHHLAIAAEDDKYERISLVAVAGSDTFWSARGYRTHPDIALPTSYGAHAVYMSMTI